MKEFKTIKNEGQTLKYLNHTITLMKTEKEVEINKIFDKISSCSHMQVRSKYLNTTSSVINSIRSWENEILSISYLDADILLGVEFNIDDINNLKEEDKIATIELKDGLSIELS